MNSEQTLVEINELRREIRNYKFLVSISSPFKSNDYLPKIASAEKALEKIKSQFPEYFI